MSLRNLLDVEDMTEALSEQILEEVWSETSALIDDTFYSFEEVVKNCVRMDEEGSVEVVLNEESHLDLYTIKENAVCNFKMKFREIIDDKLNVLTAKQMEIVLNQVEVNLEGLDKFIRLST